MTSCHLVVTLPPVSSNLEGLMEHGKHPSVSQSEQEDKKIMLWSFTYQAKPPTTIACFVFLVLLLGIQGSGIL